MISYEEACRKALQFFEKTLDIHSLSQARENESVFIFSGGPGGLRIGGCTIMVDKAGGDISVLKFPSKESSALFISSRIIELPAGFKG